MLYYSAQFAARCVLRTLRAHKDSVSFAPARHSLSFLDSARLAKALLLSWSVSLSPPPLRLANSILRLARLTRHHLKQSIRLLILRDGLGTADAAAYFIKACSGAVAAAAATATTTATADNTAATKKKTYMVLVSRPFHHFLPLVAKTRSTVWLSESPSPFSGSACVSIY